MKCSFCDRKKEDVAALVARTLPEGPAICNLCIARCFDEMSRKAMRPDRPGVHELQLVEFSLVTHCPYCGSDDWINPKKKPDGTDCTHPTRIREGGS